MSAKILVVEDNLLTLENIVFALETEDYSIEKASSPEQALTLLSPGAPDLILMDIDLNSDMDGIELAAKIHKKHPDIPIIYLTDKKDGRIVDRARNIHHAYYMTKPFEDAILLSQVELALGQSAGTVKAGPQSLFVRMKATDSYKTAIPFDQICYLQAQRVYCDLYYLPEGEKALKKLELSLNMSDTLKKLPADRFIQVHRSYCINVTRINAYDNRDIIIKDRAIPVSKSFRAKLSEYINQV